MKQFLKICLIIFVLPLVLYEGYYQIQQYQKREHFKAAALAHQAQVQAQVQAQLQAQLNEKKNGLIDKAKNAAAPTATTNTTQSSAPDTSKAKVDTAITRGDATGIHYVDRGNYWNYIENEKLFAYNEDAEKIEVATDALGFRNPSDAIDVNNPLQKNYDILLLGDSFTSAVNTKLELTLAQHFKNSGLTLYNAGIDGTGTIHQAHILNKVLAKIKPKMVVLNFYLGNDFRDNFYCEAIAPAPKIQVQEIQKAQPTKQTQESHPVVESSSFSFSYKNQLKTFIKSMVHNSGVLQLGYNTIYLPLKYKHTNMSYFNRAEMMIMSYRKETAEPDTELAIEKTDKALAYMKQMLEAKGIQFVVVGIPSKAQVIKSVRDITSYNEDKKADDFFAKVENDLDFDRPDKLLESLCKKNEIQYISLLNNFRQNSDQKLYYKFDPHWTYIGQKVAADYVIPKIQRIVNSTVKMNDKTIGKRNL